MPEYRHPRGASVAIDLGGERVVCDDDGVFEAPSDEAVQAFARAYDTTPAELRVDATEWTDRPGAAIEGGMCPWCDEYDGDAVPQHASSAHPEEWTDYKSD